MKFSIRFNAYALIAALPCGLVATPVIAQVTGTSQVVTWDCTGDYCPWGSQDSGNALVWPASAGAQSTRHGYTTSQPVYLPQAVANGAVIEITAGSATLYAGPPVGGSHRALTSLSAGESYSVTELVSGEVLSVQNWESFSYSITLPAAPPPPPPPPGTASALVTWTCGGTPCPWGNTVVGNAIEWPAVPERRFTRFAYTTNKGAYLGADRANGTIIHIFSGDVGVYAGAPSDGSHRLLANISAGGTFEVTGLDFDEVLSVQSGYSFQYEITLGNPPPPSVGTLSDLVTWTCAGLPCPWGETASAQALVWPAEGNAGFERLGYTASHGIYLPRNIIDGTTVQITSGSATAYLGTPDAPTQHALVTLSAGQSYTFTTPAEGEVLSLISESAFRYGVTLGVPVPDEEIPPPPGTIDSVPATWRCNLPGCGGPDWVSWVIDWPEWAAYSTNARAGDSSRTVYGDAGQELHPYMGAWANGCKVTAQSGIVLIIEWQRGSESWREIWLNPGETHTITLTSPENGAMIESYDNAPQFSVTLQNCTPQPLP